MARAQRPFWPSIVAPVAVAIGLPSAVAAQKSAPNLQVWVKAASTKL